jgi:hypothetical protein
MKVMACGSFDFVVAGQVCLWRSCVLLLDNFDSMFSSLCFVTNTLVSSSWSFICTASVHILLLSIIVSEASVVMCNCKWFSHYFLVIWMNFLTLFYGYGYVVSVR